MQSLNNACRYGDPEIVEMLLERALGVDPESHDTKTSESMHGPGLLATLLFRSLEHEKKVVAKLLMKYGADVNARLTMRGTRGVILQHALNWGSSYVFIADSLLEFGADLGLVAPEHLSEDGMRLYKERLLDFQSQNQSLRVQEGETQEARVDE